ncbi:MAG: hypothetical protein EHM45_04935 [Desulfobacteraceae bacterium]|nr:MAG: hypothetical protein EHM45_04935 [Desulfobacteraceae bacterium]
MKSKVTILDRIAMAVLCAVIGAILAVIIWIFVSNDRGNAKFHIDAFWFAVGSFATVGFIAGINAADFLGILFHDVWIFGLEDDASITSGHVSFKNPVFFTFILLLIIAITVVLSIW